MTTIDPETRASFREQLLATIAGSTPARAPVHADTLMAELAALCGRAQPMSVAETRAYEFHLRIVPSLRAFGFEERYHTLDPLAGPDERCGLQRAVLARVKEKFKNCGAIVALVGPRGTGKTTIAAQLAADQLWEDWRIALAPERRGVPCRATLYRKAGDLVARFKAYYGDFGTIQFDRLTEELDRLATAHGLVIDELHEVPEESRPKDRLMTDLLDKRYAARRDTLLISNQTREEFWRSLPDSIKSRLQQHGSVVPCDWKSFRELAAR